MKKEIVLLFSIITATVMFYTIPCIAQPADKTLTVDVSIQQFAEITVSPTTLTWSGINPGSTGGIKYVDVINTGSVNVSLLYAYVDTLTDESTRPYGTDNASNYAAGGVLTMINESGSTLYYFVGRLEWNWTETVDNANYTNLDDLEVAWGFFKNATNSYLWAVQNGTGGLCNNTGTRLALDDDNDDGTNDTRTPEIGSLTRQDGDEDYSFFDIDRATSPLYGSCVAVSQACNKIYIYKFDQRSGDYNFSLCTNSAYIRKGNLQPDAIEDLTTNVFIPEGMPDGTMITATVTFTAT